MIKLQDLRSPKVPPMHHCNRNSDERNQTVWPNDEQRTDSDDNHQHHNQHLESTMLQLDEVVVIAHLAGCHHHVTQSVSVELFPACLGVLPRSSLRRHSFSPPQATFKYCTWLRATATKRPPLPSGNYSLVQHKSSRQGTYPKSLVDSDEVLPLHNLALQRPGRSNCRATSAANCIPCP